VKANITKHHIKLKTKDKISP